MIILSFAFAPSLFLNSMLSAKLKNSVDVVLLVKYSLPMNSIEPSDLQPISITFEYLSIKKIFPGV
jgi:hypothetical protein